MFTGCKQAGALKTVADDADACESKTNAYKTGKDIFKCRGGTVFIIKSKLYALGVKLDCLSGLIHELDTSLLIQSHKLVHKCLQGNTQSIQICSTLKCNQHNGNIPQAYQQNLMLQ